MGLGRVNTPPKALAGGTAAPLLMGLGCVNTPLKALAGGTAAPKALAGGTAALGVEPVVGVGVGVGKAVVDGVLAGVGIP